MPTTRYIADITDPTTGDHHRLEAATEDELEHLLDQHLDHAYPLPTATIAAPNDPDGPRTS